jgi:hypothetical protein
MEQLGVFRRKERMCYTMSFGSHYALPILLSVENVSLFALVLTRYQSVAVKIQLCRPSILTQCSSFNKIIIILRSGVFIC